MSRAAQADVARTGPGYGSPAVSGFDRGKIKQHLRRADE
jgi:hypothetical protein